MLNVAATMSRQKSTLLCWRQLSSGKKTRLRQLAEDAALIRGSSAEASWTTDPTLLIAEHKVLDAQRRGVFDDLKQRRTSETRHLSRADEASFLMGKQMAAANLRPLSVDLRLRVEADRTQLRALIRADADPGNSTTIRDKAKALDDLIKRQHLAAVADAHAFSSSNATTALQVKSFDLQAEIQQHNHQSDDDSPLDK